MIMQCDNVVKVKRPDILVLSKTNECIIVDIAIQGQSKIQEQEFEKTDKCQDLKRVNRKMWGVQNVDLVPVVLGAIRSVTKKRGQWIEKPGIRVPIGVLMNTRNSQDSKTSD